jgi:hypothetical protein
MDVCDDTTLYGDGGALEARVYAPDPDCCDIANDLGLQLPHPRDQGADLLRRKEVECAKERWEEEGCEEDCQEEGQEEKWAGKSWPRSSLAVTSVRGPLRVHRWYRTSIDGCSSRVTRLDNAGTPGKRKSERWPRSWSVLTLQHVTSQIVLW